MEPVCRIEIVIGAPHVPQLLEVLERHGLRGYSQIRGVTGAGERGHRWGDELTSVSSNSYVLTTCPPARLDALADDLRPLLAQVGGMCLVSDARWLPH
jgi:PII-like signaling protein